MIYKRGKKGIYWYRFMWQGRLVRESTRQDNDKVARQMESAHRTALAKGEVGIREPKAVPTLKVFCEKRIEPWARSTFEGTCRKNWTWYHTGIRALTGYKSLADAPLNEINGELASEFAAHRLREGMQVATANNSLRVLRRILNLAAEWGALDSVPKIKVLPGERRRERVILPEEEARYLAAAPEPLASIATVLADTGMRPEECFRLRWEHVTWLNGRNGALLVTHGKTSAARRVIPMTPRVRAVLESRWNAAAKPEEGSVWPAGTRSGHVEPSSLRKRHAKAFKAIAEEADKRGERPVRPFVLYSLRHTFLTRLGQSGCDVWTLARIAGHSSIGISARYVHPSEDAVLEAISRLGGHKIGHNENRRAQLPVAKEATNAVQ
ncbi:MAG TPA: tyrosine-type recombinase/integrase [Candidatus Sulfotelmatobacter sp.]|nr:tyrosine-type recombinase/integrase [Candidatus Sulfotelmatobacter sp.]